MRRLLELTIDALDRELHSAGKPQRVGGPNAYQHQMALGAGGAAVVAYSREEDEQFTSRMSPAGTWAAPVRQPVGLPVGPRALDMDAEGRALIAWWHGGTCWSDGANPTASGASAAVAAGGHALRRFLGVGNRRTGS